MKKVTFLYISLTGNTESFIKNLKEYFDFFVPSIEIETINIKNDIRDNVKTLPLKQSTIVFLPTYLDGGNGKDSGHTEVLTNPLRSFLRQNGNYTYCLGIVGSGNRNFNNQYCLTAKQYSEEFGFPFLDCFELRGTNEDVKRIAETIKNIL